MPTRVVFRRASRDAGTVDVPGILLPFPIPPGLRRSFDRENHELIVRLWAQDSIAADDYCGRVPIPYRGTTGLKVAMLDVDPPSPWRWGDVRAMWRASLALRTRRGLRTPDAMGAAPWRQGRRVRAP